MKVGQRDCVPRIWNWKWRYSSCREMLTIAARSLSWRGVRLRQSPSGLRGGRDSRRRQFQDTLGSRTGSSTAKCLKPLYVQMAGTMSRRPYGCSLFFWHCSWISRRPAGRASWCSFFYFYYYFFCFKRGFYCWVIILNFSSFFIILFGFKFSYFCFKYVCCGNFFHFFVHESWAFF